MSGGSSWITIRYNTSTFPECDSATTQQLNQNISKKATQNSKTCRNCQQTAFNASSRCQNGSKKESFSIKNRSLKCSKPSIFFRFRLIWNKNDISSVIKFLASQNPSNCKIRAKSQLSNLEPNHTVRKGRIAI